MEKSLLSVAGYDPTSGAGVCLDLKVFQHLGFHGVGILTSLTLQNTSRVEEVRALPPDFLWNQYRTLIDDISVSGIKVGMIGSKTNIPVIQTILTKNNQIPVVVDPVFKSSSGAWLLEKEAIPSYISKIKGKASLLTPNTEEAALISGIRIKTRQHMKEAARKIHNLSQMPCLIKGGEGPGLSTDILYNGEDFYAFDQQKIAKKVHGTGCFLSSSILAYLAKGISLDKACLKAVRLTHHAINTSLPVGKGQHLIRFSPLSQISMPV
ncbi:MAG: bifunctional hydroxymethylpyrimidine kinase/phosphomethylpyrimidine kinase [Candidatus Aminicenantes bacterium]